MIANSQDISKLREDILETETLLAEGDTSWCIGGDPHETLESMKMQLAELEWLSLSLEDSSQKIDI